MEISFDDHSNAQSVQNKPGDALKAYLQSRGASPIRSRLSTPLDIASERSKRYYVRKAVQSVTAVMKDTSHPKVLFNYFGHCVPQKSSKTFCRVMASLMKSPWIKP